MVVPLEVHTCDDGGLPPIQKADSEDDGDIMTKTMVSDLLTKTELMIKMVVMARRTTSFAMMTTEYIQRGPNDGETLKMLLFTSTDMIIVVAVCSDDKIEHCVHERVWRHRHGHQI